MKVKNSLFIIVISFFSGALICYLFAQWKWLKIDTEVNVVETLIAIISIVIGIFIAVHIQKRYTQNQNLYNYLVTRLDSLWTDFNSFFAQIEQTDTIELVKVTAFVKQFQMRNTALVKLLQPSALTNNLEALTDEFESLFANGLIRQNVVYYDGAKDNVVSRGERIQTEFTRIYLAINQKS
jgi:hypothetical protein